MATPNPSSEEMTSTQPLLGGSSPLEQAAETMLAASRTMLAAASDLSAAVGPSSAREAELIAGAIELGFVRALRRESLLSDPDGISAAGSLLRLPTGGRISGTGYGRLGASITGSGARSQLYGTVGGAIGYAVGGPLGAIVGGMLGGLLGGDDNDDAERARREEELRRQWLNTPEGFEIEAYLYNLARIPRIAGPLVVNRLSGVFDSPPSPFFTWGRSPASAPVSTPIVVNMPAGAVQIIGQGEDAGERAARAFAGALGRALQLNSVVVPAAGLGGDL